MSSPTPDTGQPAHPAAAPGACDQPFARAPEASAWLAIGSNIDPLANIGSCLDLLERIPGTRIHAQSSWYRTRPWGMESQPDFINLVVEMRTGLSPWALLERTQDIEQRLARSRTVENGPRTIDLDILLFGDQLISEERLRIPHPGLLLRDFMLMPLIEIAPEAYHPERALTVSRLMQEIRYHQIIERIEPVIPGGKAPEGS